MKKIFQRNHALLFVIALLTFLAVYPSKAYAPRIPGLLERIQQPLYDRNTVATTGTGQLNFFQVPLGGDVGGGSLPYPKNFEIHAIRLINQYGGPDQRGIYVLAEPIDLIPQQNFRCEINFPVPQNLSSNVNIWIYLDGFFKREVHGDGETNFGDNLGPGTGINKSFDTRDISEGQQPRNEQVRQDRD